MTPQINNLRKTSPVVRVPTHIYGVSKEIDGKTFIFGVNLGMWPLKSIVLEKWPKTCTLNLQLLHNTKRPTKWSGHMKMIDLQEDFYIGMTQCYQAFYLFFQICQYIPFAEHIYWILQLHHMSHKFDLKCIFL